MSCWRTLSRAEAIFRILAADNQRGHYTEVLAELGPDRRLHLVRDLRAEAVEATAAAAGRSHVRGCEPAARTPRLPRPMPRARRPRTLTRSSPCSDSELPDTTAPAVAKTEEQSGAGDAAPPERSPS